MCLLTGSTLYLPVIFICDSKSGIDRTFMKYESNCKNTGTGIKNQIGHDKLKKLYLNKLEHNLITTKMVTYEGRVSSVNTNSHLAGKSLETLGITSRI